MGGKGGGTTTTRNEIPPELQQLYRESAARIGQSQDRAPITGFQSGGQAFRTAPRVDQFGQAESQIAESQRLAGLTPASRQLLNRQPVGTQNAQFTAQAAQARAGAVPGQFGQLRGVAGQDVGLQGLEQNAITRAGGISGQVGQTPGTFGGLQGYASQVPGGFDALGAQASTVSPLFNQVRGQADPRIADLIAQSDRRVTGEGLQDSASFLAANQAFESAILPQIQQSAQRAGLGRSTGLQQAQAQAQAQYLLPIIQGELGREERGLERGLGTRQFGIQTAADLGLQEALAQERGIQRGAEFGLQGQLAQERGIQRGAEFGLQDALAQERALGRAGQADQFASGLEAQIGQQLAGRQEARIGRELDAILQQGLAGERGIGREQAASQFLAGQQQAAGAQDLQRALEGLGADERSRALRFDQSQSAIGQLSQLGQLEQDYQQGIQDRQTQDFLRRQALAEQALYQPFGLVAPSAIGQSASTSGGKKGK